MSAEELEIAHGVGEVAGHLEIAAGGIVLVFRRGDDAEKVIDLARHLGDGLHSGEKLLG